MNEARSSEVGGDGPDLRSLIADYLYEATANGLFPLLKHGVDQIRAPSEVYFLTSSIQNWATAYRLLAEFYVRKSGRNAFEPDKFVPTSLLAEFRERYHDLVVHHSRVFPGLDLSNPDDLRGLGRLVSRFGPSCHTKLYVGVDICGFSGMSREEQFSARLSLNSIVQGSIRRVYRELVPFIPRWRAAFAPRYSVVSTGDGCFIWNAIYGHWGDVATFVLLCYIMVYATAVRSKGAPLLRGASTWGDAFIIPYPNTDTDVDDAVGPAVNELSRFLDAAVPGQVLVGDFSVTREDAVWDVVGFVRFVHDNLLAADISRNPPVVRTDTRLDLYPSDKPLRFLDRHQDIHYCRNLQGRLYNFGSLSELGVGPDDSLPLEKVTFTEPE